MAVLTTLASVAAKSCRSCNVLPEAKNVCNTMHLCIPRVVHDICSFQHSPDKVHLKEDKACKAHILQ